MVSNVASRAVSVASNSNARGVLKRRTKPYKIEQQRVSTKKRKLELQTAFKQQLPPGYTFVPVGTPELAEFCKERSRTRNLPVHIVNADPRNGHALNPQKVSHHIYRIGYHFRSDVVDEACGDLDYVPYQGTFIKSAELHKKQHESFIAQTLAKHGMKWQSDTESEETPDQVRAAIKELFPKIPDNDLDEIVTHAWDKSEKRVGNAIDIPLPRRVQLAVIARIRHMYTDYDSLLRAFGNWAETRIEVEPQCLAKLMEWRGEDAHDDEAFEEIVRETIVIDDDDDEDAPGGDSSDSEGDSDTSIEITHRPAAMEDLRAEEPNERENRYFQRLAHPVRSQAERTNIARDKINAARSRQQNAVASAHNQAVDYRPLPPPNVQRIYVGPQNMAEPPQQVVVGGRIMHLVRDNAPQHHANPPGPQFQRDRPVQSIERDDHPGPVPQAYHSQPTTPKAARPQQRQSQFVPAQDSPKQVLSPQGPIYHQNAARPPVSQAHHGGQVVDLVSPRRQYDQRPINQHEVIRVVPSADGRYVQAPVDQHGYARAPEGPPQAWRVEDRNLNGRYRDANASEYDPNQPLLDVRERSAYRTAPSSRHESPTQFGLQQMGQPPVAPAHRMVRPLAQYAYQVAAPATHNAAHQPPMAHSRSAPAPVHGAPAPIQQMPREYAPQPRRANARYEGAPLDDAFYATQHVVPQQRQYYAG